MTRLVRRRIIFGSDGKLDPSIVPASGGGVSDGDKGDITVSASGATWTIDAGVVTTTKLGGDITTAGKDLLDDANAAAQRTTLGLGSAALEATSYFALASHNQAASTINSGTIATARLGSGTADSTTYLRGDSTWQIITTSGASASGRTHVVPSLSNFAWINKGSATANQWSYGVGVIHPSTSSNSVAVLKKSAPSTPYTITVRYRAIMQNTNFSTVGLVWRQSSDGKLHYNRLLSNNGSLQVSLTNFASPSNPVAETLASLRMDPTPEWFRLSDDGTNRKLEVSCNGDDWVELWSGTRTTYLTPDEVGFAVNNQNTGSSKALVMSVLSWEEA